MRLLSKLLILTICITALRLVTSCCNCNQVYISFDYNDLLIRNIDNTGKWSRPSDKNIMPAKGVAFEIQVVGEEVALNQRQAILPFGFNQAKAQDCACDERFFPDRRIDSFTITTLEKINDDYCCGDDVSSIFLANTCINCEDVGNFYITIDELVNRFNNQEYFYTPINSFLIYLKVPVENEIAQFEVEIKFSDGSVITKQTNTISII